MGGARLAFAARSGEAPETARIRFPRRDEIPFDSRHRFMATLHADHDRAFVCVKGAPERLLAMCDRQRGLAGEEPLNTGAWHARVEALAAGGMRVIALATRSFPHGTEVLAPGMVETGLVLVGLLGLIDPPREEAVAAVAECQAAGIRVKMITGDHAATAGAIAREVGLRGAGDVVTGMGTRCGALDAGVVLHLMQQQGLSPTEVEDLLYRRSGVLGLSGGISAEFRHLLDSTDPRAAFALQVFVRRVAQQVAVLAVAMGGLDGLVFTAGVGENAAPVRARIVETLGWLGLVLDAEANARHGLRVSAAASRVEILVIPTDEELVVARQVRATLAGAHLPARCAT